MLKFYNSNSALKLLIFYFGIVSAIKNENNESVKEFRYCLQKSPQASLKACVGRTAISFLQRFDEKDNFTLAENVVASRDDNAAGRSLVNFLDTDPVDFRGILENAGAVFSQRSLEFHMDAIYPGLMFKIGPSADSNSVAQFMLDPTVHERNLNYEEPSTARILTKHYLLPFLLGLKFNLVALVPILFTVMCLFLKKSLFLAKLVLYISSLLGVGGIAGALGKFSGFQSWFDGHNLGGGGVGGIPGQTYAPGPSIVNPIGVYSGKNTLYSHYDQDDLQRVSPYKRQDHRVVFEKAKEMENAARLSISKKNTDNFYEYEKQLLMTDQAGKENILRANIYYDDKNEEGPELLNLANSNRYHTSDNTGWKVLNLRD